MYTLFLFLLWSCSKVGSAPANITASQFLTDPETLVSSNNFFRLGFFSPPNSTNRYVGIWYYIDDSDVLEVVWVANRDNPLSDSSGVLKVSKNGTLQVLNGQDKMFWSSNISDNNDEENSVAQLLDSGNLVLLSKVSGAIIWQSFEHPTDSMLPLMRITIHGQANKTRQTRSWKSPSDPSSGRFSSAIAPRRLPELFVWDGDRPYWRTGPWNGNTFIGLPSMYYSVLVDGFSLVNDSEGTLGLTFSLKDPSILEHYVLTYDGAILLKVWDDGNRKWELVWTSLESECDVYGKCGPFGSCNSKTSPICGCLEGFEPMNTQEWSRGNWSRGCVRRTLLQCGTTGGKADGFLRLQNIKVPDNAKWLSAKDEEECRRGCLDRCSCLAYAYYLGIGCMTWNGTLIDIQEFSVTAVDVFIRLAHSELDKARTWKLVMIVVVVTGTATFAIVAYCLWRRMGRQSAGTGNVVMSMDLPLHKNRSKSNVSEVKFEDLPLFNFEKLAFATNNFQEYNKLGQGGFGPVYKGKLEDGQEIAIKRLSRASGQGLQEFMNEVLVISKLQHRNLVRLLGCCVEGEEKILIYEYMPNKSLDSLLFDPVHRKLLDWKKRFSIIEGVCRGLLYLHRDSRLRIIHRDLKASNILLDEDLNPKISDFGMARIFGAKEDQGNTSRVVGTYGYMSPEYAMEGRFSEKSDVYSFGVLLLEIVCGKRNSSFKDHESLSLLGYVWRLWNENDIITLIDPAISIPCFQVEILKFVQLGLLCVQEFPEDRPAISTIISMLDSEISDLPQPMRPGFTQKRTCPGNKVRPNDELYCSVNIVSVTSVSAR